MPYEIRQFDRIKLRTTKNIRYMTAPPGGGMPTPHGIWSVVASVGGDLLICKGPIICRVPISDICIAGRSIVDHAAMEIMNGKGEKRTGHGSLQGRHTDDGDD